MAGKQVLEVAALLQAQARSLIDQARAIARQSRIARVRARARRIVEKALSKKK